MRSYSTTNLFPSSHSDSCAPPVSYGGFEVMELLKNLRSSGKVLNIDRFIVSYKVHGNVKTISISLTHKSCEKSLAALKSNFQSL